MWGWDRVGTGAEGATAPGVLQMLEKIMRIGEITVHPLIDGVMPMPSTVLYPDVPKTVWADAGALDENGLLPVQFGGFLAVDGDGRRVLFDLGGGPAPELMPGAPLPPDYGHLPGALEQLGYAPEDITDVVFTHLHIDHVGWASVDGVPYFPKARHHVHAEEWAAFGAQAADELIYAKVAPLADQLATWDGSEATPFPWLRLHHTAGHTLGSSVAVISSQGEQLALVGDLLHHPAAIEHPEWRCGFDAEPVLAITQRALWVERFRRSGTPLVSPHFPGLTAVTL
jgi:glyoxylase-like metal-dependent hydrolase (beta-lactamase superfamily II)